MLRERHLGEGFATLDRAAQREEISTDHYFGGVRIADHAGLHPGLYHQGLLEAARDAVHAAGAGLVVVLAPTKEAVYWQGDLSERMALEGNDRWVAQVCRSLEIPCLPLLPAFASAARQTGPLYFSQDVHWNPAGHRLAAREIARFITSS